MTFVQNSINKIKYFLVLNRETLSQYGFYQIFYSIYRKYYVNIAKYYSFGRNNVLCPACGYTGRKSVKRRSVEEALSGRIVRSFPWTMPYSGGSLWRR